MTKINQVRIKIELGSLGIDANPGIGADVRIGYSLFDHACAGRGATDIAASNHDRCSGQQSERGTDLFLDCSDHLCRTHQIRQHLRRVRASRDREEVAVSEYRQKGSSRAYDGKHKKGKNKRVSVKKPQGDFPGFMVEDIADYERRFTRDYGK